VSDAPKPTNRRNFIAAVAGTTATIAASGFAARELLAQQAGGFPVYPPPQGGWSMAWVDKVERAKHKMVFDMPETSDGMALTNTLVWLRGYSEVYKTSDSDMAPVIVVRHQAIPVVLNDAMWAKLKLGEKGKLKDPTTGENALRNPFTGLKQGDRFAQVLIEGGLDSLIARGVTILVCNLALMRNAGALAREAGIPIEQARTEIAAALVPGCILQPSGIFAVARAQEAGCHFIRSTGT